MESIVALDDSTNTLERRDALLAIRASILYGYKLERRKAVGEVLRVNYFRHVTLRREASS